MKNSVAPFAQSFEKLSDSFLAVPPELERAQARHCIIDTIGSKNEWGSRDDTNNNRRWC
jgi:hypothetical protein